MAGLRGGDPACPCRCTLGGESEVGNGCNTDSTSMVVYFELVAAVITDEQVRRGRRIAAMRQPWNSPLAGFGSLSRERVSAWCLAHDDLELLSSQ